jgi:hypothetical protein
MGFFNKEIKGDFKLIQKGICLGKPKYSFLGVGRPALFAL